MYALSEAVAQKVLTAVDAGLVHGIGIQEPGKMCVEAAVCFALGLPHGDNPPCVGNAVRSAKIRLNDSIWSSDTARAKGMRRVAIAQLGSDTLDQREFSKRFIKEIIRQIVPIALRAAASLQEEEKHQIALNDAATLCEKEPTAASAKVGKKATVGAAYAAAAADDAAYVATSAAYVATYATYVATYAAYAATAAASAATVGASAATVGVGAAYAAAAADDAAYAATVESTAAAAAAADAAADEKKSKVRDEILSQVAEIMVTILEDMKSPGCEWLYLTEA